MLDMIFSWNALQILMWVLYVPSCLGLILIVLLQKGKGSGFAGAFGVGPGSDAVFGPRATKSLPVKLTYAFATIFIVLALTLSMIEGRVTRGTAPRLVAEEELSDIGEGALKDMGLGTAYDAETGVEAVEPTPEAPAEEAVAIETETTEPVAEPVADVPEETPAEGEADIAADVAGQPES
jgi:preprotein translocase subunit SecG